MSQTTTTPSLALTLSQPQVLMVHRLLHEEALRQAGQGHADEAAAALGCWIAVDEQLHAWEVAGDSES
jgi:hypothetical protein